MDADQVAFHELTCGVPPELFDLIMNCNSAKEVWDTLKLIFDGTDGAKNKKLTTAMNEFHNFKSISGEKLDECFKRFNLTMTRLRSAGCINKSNHEINLRFLNGLGSEWTTAKMIIQSGNQIWNLSLYQVYGELQAQESTVIQQCHDIGGPLALVSHTKKSSKKQVIWYRAKWRYISYDIIVFLLAICAYMRYMILIIVELLKCIQNNPKEQKEKKGS